MSTLDIPVQMPIGPIHQNERMYSTRLELLDNYVHSARINVHSRVCRCLHIISVPFMANIPSISRMKWWSDHVSSSSHDSMVGLRTKIERTLLSPYTPINALCLFANGEWMRTISQIMRCGNDCVKLRFI